MKAQIVLTSSESKRLIAKAVSQIDSVKNALKKGIIIICRGGTNAFIAEELTGQQIDKGRFTAGYIGPKGLSVNPKIPKEIILVDGKLKDNSALSEVMKDLRTGDVIIKGANAIGPDGIPAVLLGRGQPNANGGTLGIFEVASMARGVEVIVPVGLEKLIPCSVLLGSREISSSKIDYAIGVPCGLVPIFGTVVTEIEAIEALTGAEAIPIAAGGIGGAEGSIVLLITGEEAKVKHVIKIIESIKGELPVLEPT